jgi:hypothetical protein
MPRFATRSEWPSSHDQFVPTASKTAQIAFGTAVGLRQVLGIQDGTKSLETFLTAAPEGTPILITGHSLAIPITGLFLCSERKLDLDFGLA